MNLWLKGTTALIALGVVGALAAPVMAVEDNNDDLGIEEIVVTSQKRAENLQDIPLAVTAFGGDELREADISSLQDIGNRTPGLMFSAFSVGQPEISIRGISTKEDGASASDSTVVSIDDVYIAARTAQVFDIFDLERVEVLRGPQGTLYGKNSIAGAINFVTTTPTEETQIRLRQTVGDYGRFDTGGLISGKIANNLFGKFSFSRRDYHGYLRNILQGSPYFGKRQGGANTFAWRAKLRWVPTEALEILLTADGADDNIGASNREPVGSAGPLHDCGCASDPVAVNIALGGAGDPWSTLAETAGFTDRQVNGYSLRVNWDNDFGTLTSISSFRRSSFDWLEDSEGLPPSSVFVNFDDPAGPGPAFTAPASSGFAFDVNDAATEKTRQITQELRFASPAEDRLSWIAGLFYSHERVDRTETFTFTAIGLSNVGSNQRSIQFGRSNAFAAYGQATYHVTETVDLTGGIRYSYEKKKARVAAELLAPPPLLLQPFGLVSAQKGWNNVSWRGGLDWNVTENAMLYTSVSTGFKSGGFTGSSSTAARATTPFSPEKATNYEAGLKSTWLQNRVRLNVTAFRTDTKNLQVTRFFQPVGGIFGEFITENAGKARSKGVEIEFLARPVRGLEIGGTYAYLDAKYTRFTGTPSITGTGDFTGNRMRLAPKHQFSAFSKYTFDLGNSGLVSARVDYRYQSLSFFDPNNNNITTIPGYDIWDGRLAWNSVDGRWEVAAWVKNIGNEKYRTHVFSQRGSRIAFAIFGAPRTEGMTITYNY